MVETFNSPSINAYYNTSRVHRKSIACFLYFVEWRSFYSSNLKTIGLGEDAGWVLSVHQLGKALLLWHSSCTDAAALFNGVQNVPCMQTAVAPVQGHVFPCPGTGHRTAGGRECLPCPAFPSCGALCLAQVILGDNHVDLETGWMKCLALGSCVSGICNVKSRIMFYRGGSESGSSLQFSQWYGELKAKWILIFLHLISCCD